MHFNELGRKLILIRFWVFIFKVCPTCKLLFISILKETFKIERKYRFFNKFKDKKDFFKSIFEQKLTLLL